ncbi:MAG: hypothetical protein KME54_12590 [Tolypothrix brevis GSE-NOS-MK-07-07A]|jgi:hypothetical protein|nr:hypothetical protein [Tolypothrix brevis GSE-NOS-MK-07-07A]
MSSFGVGDFIRILGRKAFNAIPDNRDLYCLTCKKHIFHYGLSYGEAINASPPKSETAQAILSILGRVNDYNPGFSLLLGNTYYCSGCRRVKAEGGILSDINNKEDVKYNP